jgi:hypothetical protein
MDKFNRDGEMPDPRESDVMNRVEEREVVKLAERAILLRGPVWTCPTRIEAPRVAVGPVVEGEGG